VSGLCTGHNWGPTIRGERGRVRAHGNAGDDVSEVAVAATRALRTGTMVRSRVADLLSARPAVALAIGGFAASTLTVVAGGHIGTVRTVIPLTSWLGLLSATGSAKGDNLPGAVMLVGIVSLVALWLVAIRINRPARMSQPAVWTIAGAWALPFVIGPPLLSNDVYTYAAQGLMQRQGISPYTHGPSALGAVRAVAAVDPNWRSATSPYGTLATVVQHLAIAISGGSPLGAVIVFRGLGVLSAIAIGLLAAELGGPRRVQAITLTAMNPLVLLQVVSADHLEGIMCALVLGALVAANQRRWVLAVVLACCAFSIKAPMLMAVLAIIAGHAVSLRPGARWRAALRDSLVAAVCVAGLSFATPHGLGWLTNLNTPALGHTPLAPASMLGTMFQPIVRSASFDDLATGGRISALLAAGVIVLYLLITVSRRSLNRTVGYGLLTIALLSPVVYPWYLLWGIVCLAPTARSARRDWLVLASAVACVYTPAGITMGLGNIVTVVAAAIGVAIIGQRELRRRRELGAAGALA
jgi:hypothetical protein